MLRYAGFRATNTVRPTSRAAGVGLCAIALGEEAYIDEWIRYHLALGVDHIHLYDNDPEQPLRDVPARYPGRVTVVSFPGAAQQFKAYNHFLARARSRYLWVTFLDLDEFMVVRSGESIGDFAQQYCSAGALALNWVMFDSNGHEQFQSRPVLERFTRRQIGVSPIIKIIARPDDVLYMVSAHAARLVRGTTVDCHGNEVFGNLNPNGSDDVACVNHYFTKSREEFRIRCARGRSDIDAQRNADRDFINFGAHSWHDRRAWDFYQQHVDQ